MGLVYIQLTNRKKICYRQQALFSLNSIFNLNNPNSPELLEVFNLDKFSFDFKSKENILLIED
jgi:hypothetical protein